MKMGDIRLFEPMTAQEMSVAVSICYQLQRTEGCKFTTKRDYDGGRLMVHRMRRTEA